jgi:hypothetical protein
MNLRDQPPRIVDQPEPGLFLYRFHPSEVWVPACIHYERGLWCAEIDGQLQHPFSADPMLAAGVAQIWHYGKRIGHEEFVRVKAERRQIRRPFGLKGMRPPGC